MDTADVIVIGLGGMGTAVAWQLARRGLSVLGLEQFAVGHDQGSSHGHTRIIRQAYYEHPSYVPLVRRAYERWYDLEQRQGRHLLTACPCLSVGRPDSPMIQGVLRSAQEHTLPVESLSTDDLRQRFGTFRFDDSHVGVLERSSGFLYVEDCVRAHLDEAQMLGAVVQAHEAVLGWEATASGVTVQTKGQRYHAAKLVITAGPWA